MSISFPMLSSEVRELHQPAEPPISPASTQIRRENVLPQLRRSTGAGGLRAGWSIARRASEDDGQSGCAALVIATQRSTAPSMPWPNVWESARMIRSDSSMMIGTLTGSLVAPMTTWARRVSWLPGVRYPPAMASVIPVMATERTLGAHVGVVFDVQVKPAKVVGQRERADRDVTRTGARDLQRHLLFLVRRTLGA